VTEDREWERKPREFHGARYQLDVSEKTQEDDPAWLLAKDAPETLPVTQAVGHVVAHKEQVVVARKDHEPGLGDVLGQVPSSAGVDVTIPLGVMLIGQRHRPAAELRRMRRRHNGYFPEMVLPPQSRCPPNRG
jgi:hypothetical protein